MSHAARCSNSEQLLCEAQTAMAKASQMQGKLSHAERLYREADENAVAAYGERSLPVASIRSARAILAMDMQSFPKAWEYAQTAIASIESLSDEDRSLPKAGFHYKLILRFAMSAAWAAGFMEEGLEVAKKVEVLGFDSALDRRKFLLDRAGCYTSMGRPADALEDLDGAAATLEVLTDVDHDDFMDITGGTARALEALGQFQAALNVYKIIERQLTAWKEMRTFAGGTVLCRAARMETALGRHDRAIALESRALLIHTALGGKTGAARVTAGTIAIGMAYNDKGEWRAAELYLLRGLRMADSRGKGEDHATLVARLALSVAMWKQGRVPEAESALRRLMIEVGRALDRDVMGRLARAYTHLLKSDGREDEVEYVMMSADTYIHCNEEVSDYIAEQSGEDAA
ncbi:MAG: hypothetical protein ACYDAG_10940 [Chloroflexota bacterium]